MIIDLRNVMTRWINLDEHTENAKAMEKQFSDLGIVRHERVSGIKIPPPNGVVGCGLSHVKTFGISKEFPTLILEDDAKVTSDFSPVIEVPDDADAIYLGISSGNSQMICVDLRKKDQREKNAQGWARIAGMFASHAILYINENYMKKSELTIKHYIDDLKQPFDIGLSQLQQQHNVYCPIKPFFVQADERDSQNKWEYITSKLRITHIVNESV